MVKQVFNNKIEATLPLPQNSTIVKRGGRKYVLISKDMVEVNKSISCIKALGLTLLTAFTFCTVLTSRTIRASLCDNWRAAFKGNRLVEKYASVPSADSLKNPKKEKESKLSEKDTLDVVYNGLIASSRVSLKELEENRKKINSWIKTADKNEKAPHVVIADINELQRANINVDFSLTQAVLRLMVLRGDIIAYEPARMGFQLALDKEGFDSFSKERRSALPFTKELLLCQRVIMKTRRRRKFGIGLGGN